MDITTLFNQKENLSKALSTNSLNLLNTDYSGYPYLAKDLCYQSSVDRVCKLLDSEDTKCISVVDTMDSIMGFLVVKKQWFDSQMLNLNVYQVTDIGLSKKHESISDTCEALLKGLMSVSKELGIDYLFYSSDTNHPLATQLVNQMFHSGFYYIGTLIKFSISAKHRESFRQMSSGSMNPTITIREAVPNDLEAIASLAKDSYKIDRFHLDPNLPTSLCDKLFEQSTINSLVEGLADKLFIAQVDRRVAGYLSARRRYDTIMQFYVGEGMISAVDPTYRGLGIFTHLSNRMWEWFLDNTEFGESGTYINNLPVHKAWTNNTLPIVRGHHQLACYLKQD